MYIVIAGGGKIGYHLTKKLMTEGHEVLLIEKDPQKAVKLSDDLGEVVVTGDACEVRTMTDAGVGRADIVAAVTGHDEDNLVICQMAKHKFNVKRTIARVNNPKNEEIFDILGISETVNSTNVIYNLIEQRIEIDGVVPVAALWRGNLELVEIDIGDRSPVLRRAIMDIKMPEHSLILAAIRGDDAIVAKGTTKIRKGDTLIALVRQDEEHELRGIFEEPD
jgi:trk system potassium uptake protein TrkA